MVKQPSDFKALLQMLQDIYEQKIPFNRVLGIQIESLKPESIRVKFQMREALIGNYAKGMLHGGVISSVLDATGGLTTSLEVLQKMAGRPIEEIENRMTKIGTIDLRVDYLRPGQGNFFISTGFIMRAGRRVTVTRMELHNDEELLIAVGTGTYLVG